MLQLTSDSSRASFKAAASCELQAGCWAQGAGYEKLQSMLSGWAAGCGAAVRGLWWT